jgi:hypothetical protein
MRWYDRTPSTPKFSPFVKRRTRSGQKTLGVTPANDETLRELVEAGAFASELDAAKFAMSIAIDRGTLQGMTEGASTKWNVGTVDPDQSLRAIIESIYPDVTEPYRLIEFFMNEGLRLISAEGNSPDVLALLDLPKANVT